jgi:ABC-type transport system substrate-binding protein
MMKNKTPLGAALFAFLLLSTFLTIPSTRATWYTPPTEKMKFPMMVLSWDDWSTHSGEAIAEQLKKVGISIEVAPTDDSAMYPRLYDRDYGLEEMSYGYSGYPSHMFYRFHSSQDCAQCGQDWSFRNATVDAVIDQMLKTTDKEKARTMMWQIDQMAAENVPYIPLFLADEYHVFRKEWTGYTVMPAGPISYLNMLTLPNIYSTAGKKDFIIAFNNEPETFSPMAATTGRSLLYSNSLYDTLLAYDEKLVPIPWMATDLPEFSSDGKTMTFHLKSGLKWHDGQPLTAKDVIFTLQYIIAQSAVGGNSGEVQKYYESGEATDALTAVIHLKEPYVWAAEAFGTQHIIPEHIWKDLKYDWEQSLVQTNPKVAIGSGPFMFSTWVPGEYVKLVKNPNWWNTGHPLIDTLFFRKIDTESARILAIQKGEADTERYSVEPAFIAQVKTNPDLVLTHAVDQWDYVLAFNNKSPPFNDTWVRRAIAYALDKDEIVKRGALGYATVTKSYCPDAFFPFWANPNVLTYPYDPAKANKILDEQGYLDIDGDGIRELKPVVAAYQSEQQIREQQLLAQQQAQMTQYLTYAAIAVIVIIAALYFVYRRRKKA